MEINRNFLAIGLSAAAFLPGCDGNASKAASYQPIPVDIEDNTLRVGEDSWADVTDTIQQHYVNGAITLEAGESCAIHRGAELVIKEGEVVYVSPAAIGTECPDGAKIDLTPAEAEEQTEVYRSFVERRFDVTNEISKMDGTSGSTVDGSGEWITLVNPNPIQVFNSGAMEYGDICRAEGTIQRVGELTTGEDVMVVVNSDSVGTVCPTGVMFLQPKN